LSVKTKLPFEFQPLTKSMSPSLNDFQNLTIGGMPETRSQTHRGQQARRSRGGRSSARGGHVAQTPTRANSQPIHGHSGLLYDIESLSPGSAQRATTGLGSEFFVDRLQSHETSRGAYYAFQLKKPVSVRIHNPANGNKVECTCEEYQQSQSACVHVYVSTTIPIDVCIRSLTHAVAF
jgi:hypothetical protein